MTGEQSRQLSVGDRVCWNGDQNDHGTVTEKNWAGLTVKWDNRSEQAIPQLHGLCSVRLPCGRQRAFWV
jgi:hypothetical protein